MAQKQCMEAEKYPSKVIKFPQKGKVERCKVIAVTSGKGGVGKTNVVVNLALALIELGKRVMILDADLALANIDVLLGLVPKFNLQHVLTGQKKLSDILVEGPRGIKILPASSGIMEMAQLTESQKLILLNGLDGLEEEFDLLLIDTAAGVSSNVVYFNLAAEDILVIVSPEPTAITDAYALMKILFTRYQEKSFRLLVNSVHDSREADEVYRRLSLATERFLQISLDYLGYIPLDDNIPRAVKQQRAVVEAYPYSQASRSFFQIARSICQLPPAPFPKGNIQFMWQKWLECSQK
ncbi:MAG: flagellar synthesis regulator FleN [Nitrospinae bacterium RIFCSPLOWO2_12_FULL_45_22]|nr:MAG: flagellar synthesis regulator FleN [Nitrospinae bacterium RIFCSPLOWO2_12_FULL_45_22]